MKGADRPAIGKDEAGAKTMTLSAYVPILALFALAALFALFSVGVSQMVGPKRANRAKFEAYECGIEPSPEVGE